VLRMKEEHMDAGHEEGFDDLSGKSEGSRNSIELLTSFPCNCSYEEEHLQS